MHKATATLLTALALALAGAGALGASELVPIETGDGDSTPEIEPTVCGQGVLKECGSITSQRCTQWVVTNVSGGGSVGPSSGSVSGSGSMTCSSWTTTYTKLYKDRYKQKTS